MEQWTIAETVEGMATQTTVLCIPVMLYFIQSQV